MNKVQLIGRLTKDPELRYTRNQIPVASYSIAVNEGYGDDKVTTYVNLTTWGKPGEFVSKYFKKGQAIAIVGRLNNNNYEDKDGKKVYTLEVVTEEIEFVGDKKETSNEEKEDFTGNNIYQDEIVVDDDDLPF